MNATDVIGFTADADMYCPACAALIYDRMHDDGILRTVNDPRPTFAAIDHEGNEVHPIFGSDEFRPDDACARCGELLKETDDMPELDDDECAEESGPAWCNAYGHDLSSRPHRPEDCWIPC